MGASCQLLSLKLIRTDGATQSSEAIDEPGVADYLLVMLDGGKFPALIVFFDGSKYWLADGFHRLLAAQSIGRDEMLCDVRQGTRRDAVLFATGANTEHGLRRTNADKRRAVLMLLEDDEWALWSDRAIARHCGVDDKFVGNVRKESSADNPQIARKVERDGRTYTMNIENIGKRPPEDKRGLVQTAVPDILDFDDFPIGGDPS